MFDELKKMNAELEELKNNHLERSKIMFHTVAKKVFERHEVLESFGWRQYTPYFNDGDECTFSVHADYPDINGENEDDRNDVSETKYQKNEQTGKYDTVPNDQYNPLMKAALDDVKEFLSNIDDSVFRDMFGDHVRVLVTKEGTEVDEYDHD